MLFAGLIDVVTKRRQAQELTKHPKQIFANPNQPLKESQTRSIDATHFFPGKDQSIKLPPLPRSTIKKELQSAAAGREENITNASLDEDRLQHHKQELIYKLRYNSFEQLLGQLDALLERCLKGGFENFERSAYGKQFGKRKIILSPNSKDKNLSALSKHLIKKFSNYQPPQNKYLSGTNMPFGVKKLWYLRELVAKKVQRDFNRPLISQLEPRSKVNLLVREEGTFPSVVPTISKGVTKENFIKFSLKDYYGYLKNRVFGALSSLNRCFLALKNISGYLFNSSAVFSRY